MRIRHVFLIVFLKLLFIFIEIYGNRIQNLNKIVDHINAKEHDSNIDHEAFLGLDDSKKFDNLTEEESKIRLRKLIKTKVDLNSDDVVNEDELRQWITHISRITKEKERDDMFKRFSNTANGFLDYESYVDKTYGPLSLDHLDVQSKENLFKMKMQDLRKWEMVDENKDNKLDKNEFLVFLHPEDYPKMKSLVVQEALEVSDKNNDGYLDVEEYINDIWPPDSDADKPDEQMISVERQSFKNQHDKDQNGMLDRDEIGEWLIPSNYDATDAETQHLMEHSDADKNGQLSIEEIIDSHEIFVGSLATDYGNSLKHEEL